LLLFPYQYNTQGPINGPVEFIRTTSIVVAPTRRVFTWDGWAFNQCPLDASLGQAITPTPRVLTFNAYAFDQCAFDASVPVGARTATLRVMTWDGFTFDQCSYNGSLFIYVSPVLDFADPRQGSILYPDTDPFGVDPRQGSILFADWSIAGVDPRMGSIIN
jgi:hypothetical protein